jgi:hypothetical protein
MMNMKEEVVVIKELVEAIAVAAEHLACTSYFLVSALLIWPKRVKLKVKIYSHHQPGDWNGSAAFGYTRLQPVTWQRMRGQQEESTAAPEVQEIC